MGLPNLCVLVMPSYVYHGAALHSAYAEACVSLQKNSVGYLK